MKPEFEINIQQHYHIIYLTYEAFYSTSVTWSTWTTCLLELQNHREITQILLLKSLFACESNYCYWYSRFQVTAMIEWGKNQNPNKCLDQTLISNKSHAEFPSHKHSLKAWYKHWNPYSKKKNTCKTFTAPQRSRNQKFQLPPCVPLFCALTYFLLYLASPFLIPQQLFC